MCYVNRIERAIAHTDSFRDDNYGLLKALLPHREQFRHHSEIIRRGTVLWSLAGILEELNNNPTLLARLIPTPGMDSEISNILRRESVITATIVFRSWVSLVYMRSDDILITLRRILNPDPHLSAFIELLGLDDVRHIRNAISHGTFEAEFQEFRWRDRSIEGLLSYDLLSRLNLTIFTLWLSLDTVSIAPDDATLP